MPRNPTRTEPERVKIGSKRQLTLPKKTMDAMKLREGDLLAIRTARGVIELVPLALIPRDQLWYWTPEWQHKEREAEENIRQGRVKAFKNAKAAIAWLRS